MPDQMFGEPTKRIDFASAEIQAGTEFTLTEQLNLGSAPSTHVTSLPLGAVLKYNGQSGGMVSFSLSGSTGIEFLVPVADANNMQVE